MKNFLAEIRPYDPATDTVVTLRLSGAWATSAGVVLNGEQWLPLITEAPKTALSYFSGGDAQGASIGYGSLGFLLNNSFANQSWSNLSFDGAMTTVWVGENGDDFADYKIIFSGNCGALERDGQEAKLTLLGSEALLETPLLKEYLGSGDGEGDVNLRGNLKPRAYGVCANVQPTLIDAARQIYQFHDGAAGAVSMVYENAYEIAETPAATVSTYAALRDAVVETGTWIAAPAIGMFRLGSQPSGKITADVTGATAAGSTIASIATHLITSAGASVNTASLNAWTQSWSLYSADQISVGDAVRLAFEGLGFVFSDSLGQFRASSIWGAPSSTTVLKQNRSAMPLVNSIKQLAAAAPAYQVKVGHTRCWSTHSESEISEALRLAGLGTLAAQEAAQAAQQAADDAQADADALGLLIDNFSQDGVLSSTEKRVIMQRMAEYNSERATLETQADALSITTEKATYSSKLNALNTYLGNLAPAWNDITEPTPISRTTFEARFTEFANAKTALLARYAAVSASLNAWTPLQSLNVLRNGSTFTKTSGSAAYDARLWSAETHTDGVTLSFKPYALSKRFVLGLDEAGETAAGDSNMQFAFRQDASGNLTSWVAGASNGNGVLAADDLLTITYSGDTVRFFKNGTLLRSSATTAGLTLGLAGLFWTVGSGVKQLSYASAGRAGDNALSGNLTNDSHVVSANSLGVVASFTGAGGTFKVYRGSTDISSTATYAKGTETGLSATINATTGVYSVSAMSAESGTVVLNATVGGSVITKTFTVTKARTGTAGSTGPTGAAGVQGVAGETGATLYTWVAYSNNATGSNGFTTGANAGQTYIGIATNKTSSTESTSAADYTWSRITGDDGVQGPAGENGDPTFVWFAYASNLAGTANFTTGAYVEGTHLYIGIAANKSTATESTNPADYTWSRLQGIAGTAGPQGSTGATGAAGPQGTAGTAGVTLYTWIAYANNATGTSGFTTGVNTGQTYIGIATNKLSSTESTSASDYTWSRIQGDQGVQGPNGFDGTPRYVWFAYASNATGTANFTTGAATEGTHTYVGISANRTTATEGTNPADYFWSRMEGATGPQGPTGAAGVEGAPAFGAITTSFAPGKVGGSGDFVFRLDMDSLTTVNKAEIFVTGSRFYHPDGTLRTGALTGVIATDYGEGSAGRFFLVYSEVKKEVRFPGLSTTGGNLNIFAARPNAGGGWEAVGNGGGVESFTPLASDCILAVIEATQWDGLSGIHPYVSGAVGLDGAPGAQGSSGLNNATVFIFRRANGVPNLPTADTTYNFATRVVAGLNNLWESQVPAGSDPLYVSVASASSTANTDVIGANEWAAPTVLARDGGVGATGPEGAPGLNSATVFLYRRTSGWTPNPPNTTTIFDFTTGVLTGQLDGYTQTVPGGSGPCFITTATASSASSTDAIAPVEWATPVIFVQDGATGPTGPTGPTGTNSAPITIYQRSATEPALPTATSTYTFASGALTGLNNGWSNIHPSGYPTLAQPLWVSQATAASNNATDTIASSEWTPATRRGGALGLLDTLDFTDDAFIEGRGNLALRNTVLPEHVEFKIGGANLLSGSDFSRDEGGWYYTSSSYASFVRSGLRQRSGTHSLRVIKDADGGSAGGHSYAWKRDFTDIRTHNQKVTVSVWSNGTIGVPLYLRVGTVLAGVTSFSVGDGAMSQSFTQDGKWQRCSVTLDAAPRDGLHIRVGFYDDEGIANGNFIYFDDVQVEIGDVLTEWKPYAESDASYGATWGTNTSGRPVELTDGRIAAGLTSAGDLNRNLTVSRLNSSNILRRTGGGVFGGDLTATAGADWAEATGGGVRNRPLELTDGRVPAALTSSGRLKDATNMFTAYQLGIKNTSTVAITALDAGSSATISVAAHNRGIPNVSGTTTVSYNSGMISGMNFSTRYFVYCDDPNTAGGAVSYYATTNGTVLAGNAGRVFVGEVTTPADGGSGTDGGSGGGGSYGGGGGAGGGYVIP